MLQSSTPMCALAISHRLLFTCGADIKSDESLMQSYPRISVAKITGRFFLEHAGASEANEQYLRHFFSRRELSSKPLTNVESSVRTPGGTYLILCKLDYFTRMATAVLFANMMSMPVDSMWHDTATHDDVDFAMPAVEANTVLSVCLQLVV